MLLLAVVNVARVLATGYINYETVRTIIFNK